MAWNYNPPWVSLGDIHPDRYSSVEGLLASAYNKVLENMQYLYNHLGDADVMVDKTETYFVAPGQSITISTPDGSKVVPYPGDILLYMQEVDHGNGVHSYAMSWYMVLPIPKLSSSVGDVDTTIFEYDEAGNPPANLKSDVTITPSYTNTGANFSFAFNLAAIRGPRGFAGPEGPRGPSVAAGLQSVNIDISDWTGTAGDWSLTITSAQHQLGETSQLVAFPLVAVVDGEFELVYNSPLIQDDGTIVIKSNRRFSGKCLVCGGFAEAVDNVARTRLDAAESAISQNTQDIESLRDEVSTHNHYLGAFSTPEDLEAWPNPTPNDVADVYSTGTQWSYSPSTPGGTDYAWRDSGKPIAAPTILLSDATPKGVVIGNNSAGTGSKASREDHVHSIPVGTTANTVAAGNDSRILSAVQTASFAGVAFVKAGTALSITQESARSALQLGTAAYTASTAYASASQGAKADKAATDIEGIKTDIENLTELIGDSITSISLAGSAFTVVGGVASMDKATARAALDIPDAVNVPEYSRDTAGIVPAAGGSTLTRYFREDGTWVQPPQSADTKNTAGATNNTAKLFLVGAPDQEANPTTYSDSRVYINNGEITASKVWNAVFNDYAEFRKCLQSIQPGYVVTEDFNMPDYVRLASNKSKAKCFIVTDTFGSCMGDRRNAIPVALAGRALAYFEGNKKKVRPGDYLGVSKNGKVRKVSRLRAWLFPDKIIGTVSAIPTYTRWGSDDIEVDGRIWVNI